MYPISSIGSLSALAFQWSSRALQDAATNDEADGTELLAESDAVPQLDDAIDDDPDSNPLDSFLGNQIDAWA